MHELWFWLVSVMVALYVALDGFDFGAGILHLFVARADRERREVLAAIGPLWDGNEVWLLAAGGSLLLSFPKVLASGFSGFYLPLFLVLWTLILRGSSIEFRSHVVDPLWRAFWDAVFALSSVLLPILLGAALGNVLRGVPLDADGWFELPLFTNFGIDGELGVLDWYTVLIGVFALVAIAAHGAVFLAWKTSGPVQGRSLAIARPAWIAVAIVWIVATVATRAVNPALLQALPGRPLAWLGTALAIGGYVFVWFGLARRRELASFLGSCCFLVGLLAATAACVFPVMLGSRTDPARSLTALNAGSSVESLRTGLYWWFLGLPIAVAYFAFLFHNHRGKVTAARDGEGY